MRVCLETGAAGEDATDVFTLEPSLLSEVYLLPYLALESGLATVVAGRDGPPVGYVLGALDTAAFEAAAEERWWPSLRERFPRGAVADDSPEAVLVRRIHEPPSTPPEVLRDHPSHLHVDLLPAAQGRGLGRRLLERLFDQLAAAGSTGVHLGVSAANVRAIGFYRAMGFVEWPSDGSGSLTLVRRLQERA
ncbi:MAG: GNAT family N-acetyltransferase [Acidimicrobiia bacterium]|nr:GNAT family N-acetyltransferase [Acidimicrobiia bacterium]